MGNSIHGQYPSMVFTVIKTNILNTDIHSKEEYMGFKFDKYNFLIGMQKLAEIETVFFDSYINYLQGKKNNISSSEYLPQLKQFIDATIQLTHEAYNLELLTDKETEMDGKDINEHTIDENFEQNYPGMWYRKMAVDTLLLDLTYGKLQLELAKKLLAEHVIQTNTGVIDTIKSRWDNYTTEKSSRALQEQAAQLVQPCQEALNNWFNWSII